MTSRYTAPGEGTALDTFDGIHTVKVGAEQTGGAYEIFEVVAPRAPTVPLHRTPWAKAFYLLDGAMTVRVDGDCYELGPGATVAVPEGAAHTFEVTTVSAKFLAFHPDRRGRASVRRHRRLCPTRPTH